MMNLYDGLHDKVLTKYAKNPMTECYSSNCVFKYQEEIYDATVIIPCYNVEHYITECLDSMLNQNTSYNVEIIEYNIIFNWFRRLTLSANMRK